MNLERLRKSIGSRVQLQPVAIRLDEHGIELPSIDDDWIVESVTGDGATIRNIRTSHKTTLGLDHIHHFTTNPDRCVGELAFGFFTLIVQVYIQGMNLWVRPNSGPGKRVDPEAVLIVERSVDINFPRDSGLLTEHERLGYRVAWCMETKIERRVSLEGWEYVVHKDAQGRLTRYRLRDRPHDQLLIKKRE